MHYDILKMCITNRTTYKSNKKTHFRRHLETLYYYYVKSTTSLFDDASLLLLLLLLLPELLLLPLLLLPLPLLICRCNWSLTFSFCSSSVNHGFLIDINFSSLAFPTSDSKILRDFKARFDQNPAFRFLASFNFSWKGGVGICIAVWKT